MANEKVEEKDIEVNGKEIEPEEQGINPTDVWSSSENENQQEEEKPEKESDKTNPKMTFSEKRTISIQEKLKELREKISENPPKTLLGKKIANAKLTRLQSIVDKRILKNNIKTIYESKQYNQAERYYNAQQGHMDRISDLSLEKEDILRELGRLDRFDPNSRKSEFAKQQKKIAKQMPKGYKATRSGNSNAKVVDKKRELLQRLNKIEEELELRNKLIKENDEIMKNNKAELKADKKQDLAMVRKTGIFAKIKSFFKQKVEQFKEWRENKNTQASQKLSDTLENTKESTAREMFLKSNASNISLEDQKQYSQQIQEQLNEREANNDKQKEEDNVK